MLGSCDRSECIGEMVCVTCVASRSDRCSTAIQLDVTSYVGAELLNLLALLPQEMMSSDGVWLTDELMQWNNVSAQGSVRTTLAMRL